MEKLALIDIDGTLVKSIPGNPHAKAFTQSIENLYGLRTNLDWSSVAGLTDRLIFLHILEREGWPAERVVGAMAVLMAELQRVYTSDFVAGSVETMPGVENTLETLKALDVRLGLVTGNLYPIAETKLTDAGIFSYFDVGGYGSDEHTKRSELVTLAVSRANMSDQVDNVYVIGDTPRDVAAALEAGVHAIGYSASHHSSDELYDAHAESVIGTFEDWDQIASALNIS